MGVLTDDQRKEVTRRFSRVMSDKRDKIGALTKGQIRTAVNQTDDWINANWVTPANIVAYNESLSAPIKTNLTKPQKQRLFWYVAEKRFEVGA